MGLPFGEVWEPTGADDSAALDLARSQDRWHHERGTPDRCASRGLHVKACGILAEWAVADSLGVERGIAGRVLDGGIDLTAPSGTTLAVRYRNRSDADLMTPDDRPFTADAVVLVVAYGPRALEIAGGITTRRFYALARRGASFGHEPTTWCHRDDLTPWVEVRRHLTRPARIEPCDS